LLILPPRFRFYVSLILWATSMIHLFADASVFFVRI